MNLYPAFLIVFLSCFFFASAQKEKIYVYQKNKENQLLAKGWMHKNTKVGYWYHYHNNGKISAKGHYDKGKKAGYWFCYDEKGILVEEGHCKNDFKTNWWVSYELDGVVAAKQQFKKDKKDGYRIIFEKGKPIKVEKYKADKKIGEWKDLRSFQLENSLISFQ